MKKKQKIVIPLSESDLEDLQAGEEFHWTFPTDKGEDIDVHLRQETQEDIDEFCSMPNCNELSAVGGMCLEHYQRENEK